MVALGVVDSESGDHPLGLFVGDEFGNRFLAEALGDPDDRCDYELVDVARGRVLAKLAVDLDIVERQVLEVVEGAKPGAEVV